MRDQEKKVFYIYSRLHSHNLALGDTQQSLVDRKVHQSGVGLVDKVHLFETINLDISLSLSLRVCVWWYLSKKV